VFVFTLSMSVVRRGREGTDFTIQIVLTHLSSLMISVLSGKVADMVGYRGLFVSEAVIGMLIIAALFFLYNPKFYDDNEHSGESD
ncbi:MAG: hypothetical protein FWG22_05395, partial [Prolixibacteraceae bacterium]|nr:hypothetical protein [Prolixibacteraceae bacterium]